MARVQKSQGTQPIVDPKTALLRFFDWVEENAGGDAITIDQTQAARNALSDLDKLEKAGKPAPSVPAHASGVKQITVTWGEENHSPIQYNGFRCGDITLVAEVSPSETVEEAYARLYDMLEDLGKKQFKSKLDGFLERAKAGAVASRAAAGRK